MLRSLYVSLTILVLTEATPMAPQIANPANLMVTTQAANTSNSLWASLGASSIDCNGEEYGSDLRYDSCHRVVNSVLDYGLRSFTPGDTRS